MVCYTILGPADILDMCTQSHLKKTLEESLYKNAQGGQM